MQGRFLDWLGAGDQLGAAPDELSETAQEVDTALSWLRAAGDMQAERWGESVAEMTSQVEAMRDRFPELGHPTRSLVVAAFITFARSSGLSAAELADLVEIPDWMQKDVDLMRVCDSMTGLRSERFRVSSGTSAGHSCRSASRRGAGISSERRIFDATDGGFPSD